MLMDDRGVPHEEWPSGRDVVAGWDKYATLFEPDLALLRDALVRRDYPVITRVFEEHEALALLPYIEDLIIVERYLAPPAESPERGQSLDDFVNETEKRRLALRRRLATLGVSA